MLCKLTYAGVKKSLNELKNNRYCKGPTVGSVQSPHS
jgi:hypothetical protein